MREKSVLALMPVFILVLAVFMPAKAFAQCEKAAPAIRAMISMINTDNTNINNYITQEENFIDKDLAETATYEIRSRLDEFDKNIMAWLNWWSDELVNTTLRDMAKQISIAQIDQTRAIGSLMDAQLNDDATEKEKEKQDEARQRYMPSELACQADTVGPGLAKSYQISRALSRGFAIDDAPRQSNAKGDPSSAGTGAEIKSLWDEYVTYFCDNGSGDQGCTVPGTLAGQHTDIPSLLWGDKQTIDMSVPDNAVLVKAAMRYLIHPLSVDPVPGGAVETTNGRQALLTRRSEAARINTIYNVMGQMIGERVGCEGCAGGSGVNTQSLRIAAGIPAASASTNASYREIQESMTKDRFHDPEYIVRMVNDPEQVIREQDAVNSVRLQMMNDIYHRSEEMLFMEAADYSRDLDKLLPTAAVSSLPVK